jgi:carbon starvation protein
MVLEGFVAVAALVAACALQPGDYFFINVAQDNAAQRAAFATALEAAHASDHPWPLWMHDLRSLEQATGERLQNRPGGAVTLAVGMAKIFSTALKSSRLTDYWYHFIIMFEALFILTLLETGTRVARFIARESFEQFRPSAPGQATSTQSKWVVNIVTGVVTCAAWGYLLYRGDIKGMWLLLGIANQLLATIGLAVGTTYLLRHAPKRRYALCTGIPFVLALLTVDYAGGLCVRTWWLDALKPGTSAGDAFFFRLMSGLGALMMVLNLIIAAAAASRWVQLLSSQAHGEARSDQAVGVPVAVAGVLGGQAK